MTGILGQIRIKDYDLQCCLGSPTSGLTLFDSGLSVCVWRLDQSSVCLALALE